MTEQDFQINDDLELNPETYPDRDTTVRPPLPGNYLFTPAKWDFRRDKSGELVRWKDKDGNPTYPVISLTTVEISDPQEYARKVVLFQDIPTYPFEREGKRASAAADLLRSLDATITASNTGEVIRLVTERLQGAMPFRARLDYAGYDSEYAKAQIALLPADADKKAKNEVYKRAKIQGYRNIQKANAAAGQPNLPIHKWVGPSGSVVDVKPTLTIFYPADEEPTLGPDKALVGTSGR